MKNHDLLLIIASAAVLAACLCACRQDPAPKSPFGQIDATQDGVVLVSNAEEGSDESGDGEEDEKTTTDTIKTSTQLDVNDLPVGIQRMTALCDAVNMACVELQKVYSADNNELIWHSVHMYVGNCKDADMGFKRVGEYIEADPKIVDAAIYAMFGKLRSIPEIPDNLMSGAENDPNSHIQISNDLKYRFTAGDRGTSAPDVRRVTEYSDGSCEMEVALVDTESGEETVSFIYTLRANTRDTTTTAVYDYEITGVRAADRITSDKMNGTPFLTSLIQTYDGEDVVEVLYFNSFKEHVPGMEELDQTISRELVDYATDPVGEGKWHSIISYPVTTDDYVQFAVTYDICPDEDNDPGIHSYNYDKKKSRAMDLNDAYGACGITADKLSEKVTSLYMSDHPEDAVSSVSPCGFIVLNDGSVLIFHELTVTEGDGGVHKRLATYDSASSSLKYYKDTEDFIPGELTDTFKPPLTHGRKGDQADGR